MSRVEWASLKLCHWRPSELYRTPYAITKYWCSLMVEPEVMMPGRTGPGRENKMMVQSSCALMGCATGALSGDGAV